MGRIPFLSFEKMNLFFKLFYRIRKHKCKKEFAKNQMTPQDRISLTRVIILEVLQICDLNAVQHEHITALLQRIDTEIVPFASEIPDEATKTLLKEILKVASIAVFAGESKVPSCRVTKKAIKKFFKPGTSLPEALVKMKASRYGLALSQMNINQFMKILGGQKPAR